MKSSLLRIHYWLINLNKFVLVMVFVLGIYVSAILMSMVSNIVFKTSLTEGSPKFASSGEKIFLGVLVAPLLETLLFQVGIIETAKKKMSTLFSSILSAIIFGFSHFYNFFYFLYGICAGLLLAYLYYIATLTRQGFIVTFSAHALFNLCVLFLSYL